MGRNKALLSSHGKTLCEMVAGALVSVTGSVCAVGGPPAAVPVPCRFVPDLYPGEGPLGGILSALHDSGAGWNLVAACDMPSLRVDFLRRLLEMAEQSDCDAVVPIGPSGRLEPLCAAYHRNALPGLQAAFDRGVRKIAEALREIRLESWQVPEELSCFQNVNTPEDWAAYER